jgi:hypothetical protein
MLLKPATGKKTLLTPFYNWFNRSVRLDDRPCRELHGHPGQKDVPEPGVHGRADA